MVVVHKIPQSVLLKKKKKKNARSVFSMKKLLSIVPVSTRKYLRSTKNIVQMLVMFFHDFSYL